MSTQPTGTVTLLFTDIERSTRLWYEPDDAMRIALERHDDLLRRVMEEEGGYVFKTVGDAFHVAFASPILALVAAVNAQRRLGAEGWGGLPLRVRMALHTGTAEERGGDYFGLTPTRTARLRDAAHGGQILLSRVAAGLVSDALPPDITLRDLGEHRLKDLQEPMHIVQAVHPALRAEFPPPNSLSILPN